MPATMDNPPPPLAPWSNRQVTTIRGQYHKFALIPMIEQHARWFDGGLISVAVEARALGDSAERMVRGPSIHVFDAARTEEYLRFDIFGGVPHYHYILQAGQHNVLWGYDSDANGPMLPWVIAALRDRLPALLRNAGADRLAADLEMQGWDTSILHDVARTAAEAMTPRADDLVRAQEGMDWMCKWKAVHPQFNTVVENGF